MNLHLKGPAANRGKLVRAVESIGGVLSAQVDGNSSLRVLFNPDDTSEEEVARALGGEGEATGEK